MNFLLSMSGLRLVEEMFLGRVHRPKACKQFVHEETLLYAGVSRPCKRRTSRSAPLAPHIHLGQAKAAGTIPYRECRRAVRVSAGRSLRACASDEKLRERALNSSARLPWIRHVQAQYRPWKYSANRLSTTFGSRSRYLCHCSGSNDTTTSLGSDLAQLRLAG